MQPPPPRNSLTGSCSDVHVPSCIAPGSSRLLSRSLARALLVSFSNVFPPLCVQLTSLFLPLFFSAMQEELEAEMAALESSRQGNRRPDKVYINNKAGLEASILGMLHPRLHRSLPPHFLLKRRPFVTGAALQ